MAAADREVENILAMPDNEVLSSAEALLEWMTYYHLPLQLWQEDEDEGASWVVCDNSQGTIIGSGGSALDALRSAHSRVMDKEQSE